MNVITKKEVKISNRYESIQNLSKRISLKLLGVLKFCKKIIAGFIQLVFRQKREPSSVIAKKTYLHHQHKVNTNHNLGFRMLR